MLSRWIMDEIAHIRRQIAAEYESAQRALRGSAYGTSQHKFITRRMERMGGLHGRLKTIVGDDQATRILNDAMEGKN